MNNDGLMDVLTFRRMISPIIIQIVFWLGVVGTLIGGLVTMFTVQFITGLLLFLFGPLMVRIYCELLIVIFRVHSTLEQIREQGNMRGAG